jgi:zinc/manganese transport system substrate-binding protein
MKSFLIALALLGATADAKLKVVTSTADLAVLAAEVGGADATVESIAKGTQDPHAIEPKPSYMLKMNRADLVIANGLSLEIGWLPSLLQGARNPKVLPGSRGFLDLGESAEPIDIPAGKVTRAMGDVHPDGNPHYMLDPVRTARLAGVIAARLGELQPGSKDAFAKRAADFAKSTEAKVKDWSARIAKTGITEVVTYHPSLNYFLARFGLKSAGFLEPKPGIPPSAKHIVEIIGIVKAKKIPLILVDNFYDSKIADRIRGDVPAVKIKTVGISVGSAPGLNRLEDVTEQLVRAIEEARP